MGNSVNKFRKALQQGNELLACQLYVQNPDIRERLDPNSSDKDNQQHNTPLHYAAKFGMKSLLRDFLIRGGNPNKQNSLDQTALHMLMMTSSGTMEAVDQRRLDCLHMLLKWKGKMATDGLGERLYLDAADRGNKTALHFAAASGLSLCVQGLVEHGASIFLEDDQHLSACDIAEQNQHDAIAAYLEAKMVFNVQEEDILEPDDVDLQPVNDEEYSGVCAQDLQEIKDQLIVETSDMLQVPLFTAEALLRNHDWSREMLLESWMEDPLAACEKAGVKLAQDHVAVDVFKNKLNGARKKTNLPSMDETQEHNCDICDEVLPADGDRTEIPCGHMFCDLCWERYLSTKIKDGETQNILCPGHDCNKLVPVEITEKLVSRDMAKRYLQFDIKAFVDTNPNLRWCPHPGCGRAVKLPEVLSSSQRQNASANAKAKAVDCGHGHYFCWICLGEAHEPCTCETWQKWLSTVEDINPNKVNEQSGDRESVANAYWLISNSKKCPNCRSHIQKNEGCNHMTCSKCKHDFCWVCLEPWKLHSAETGGYFRCNRYDVVNVVEDSREQEFKKVEKEHDEVQRINRFMHYYTRCKNHENSFEMEMKLLNAAQEKVSGLQKTAVQLDFYGDFDANFIEESIKELLKSRQILKGSYPYGYFLENDRGQRIVFESMQDEVEQATETLSGMVARPFLKTPRKKIINATRKLRRKKREFLGAIERGLIPDDFLIDFSPSSSFQPNVQTRVIHQRESDYQDNAETLNQGRGRRRQNAVYEPPGSESDRTPEQMGRQLMEWLELIGLELRDADSSESNSGRVNAISRLRRRFDEVYRRKASSKKKKKKTKGKNVPDQNVDTEVVGTSSTANSERLRSRLVLFAEDSSSSGDETGRARRNSDPPLVVTDDSDSDSDYSRPSRETAASASEPKKTVVAQFDYSASSPMEISLEAGDIIEVLEKRSDGWWRGICRGKEGHFPSHFVVELEAIEDTNLEALKENAATGHSSSENVDDMLQQALALSLAEYESQELSTNSQWEPLDLLPSCASRTGHDNTNSIQEPEHEE